MTIAFPPFYRYILLIVALITGSLAVVSFIISPAVSADPAEGFQVLRSMQLGSNFNYLTSPYQEDISKNVTQFFTWWSPGQYCLPYGIQWLSGLCLGKSIVVTVTLAEIVGLTGFYFFFKKLGFSKLVASASLLLIVCQKAFMNPHIYYDGGEVLLFSFGGWFLYGCLMSPVRKYYLVFFIVLAALWGFFLKSSFLWIFGAGIFCLFIRCCLQHNNLRDYFKCLLWTGVPAIIAIAALYFAFIARGISPAQVHYGFRLSPEAVSYPLASPLLSGLSVDEMLGGLMVPTGYKLLISFGSARLVLLFCAISSLVLIYFIMRFVKMANYRLMLLVFFVSAVVFFTYVYLRQYEISMEPRHFRIVGILVIPGMLELLIKVKPRIRVVIIALFTCVASFNFSYIINGFKSNSGVAKGHIGIGQPNIDQISLNKVLSFDNGHRNVIFVFLGNDAGLEIRHNRIISLDPLTDDMKVDTDRYTYNGHGGMLYIVLPRFYKGNRQVLILSSFPGYKHFAHDNLSAYYEAFIAN